MTLIRDENGLTPHQMAALEDVVNGNLKVLDVRNPVTQLFLNREYLEIDATGKVTKIYAELK